MTDVTNSTAKNSEIKKEEWVEPEASEMDMAPITKGNPGVGVDGGGFVDCTLS